jgi:alpha-maltose-1-phosphate synthase
MQLNSKSKGKSNVLLFDNQGLSHYTSYLALGLSKYQDVILYGFSINDFLITGASKEKKIAFYPLEKKLPNGSSVAKIMARSLLLFLIFARELNMRKYDIVHIQERLPMFFLFLPLLKIKRKRLFWTVHDVNLLPLSEGFRGKMEVLYRNSISQPYLLAKYADGIIVHAQSLKEQLIAKKIDQNKIHVIHHLDYGYLLKCNNNSGIVDSDSKIKNDSYALFFGDITPWKGIDTLIAAAKIVREKLGEKFGLVIAGRSYHEYMNVKSMVKRDCNFVKVIDKFVVSSEIPGLLRNSNFLVLPYNNSFQYSASGVIPLAYTFSKPVIVSDIPSIVEYVDHGKTGFIFESGNSIQLANYIVDLIENKEKCVQMGRDAYKKLIHEMSLELCCKKLSELYRRCQEDM